MNTDHVQPIKTHLQVRFTAPFHLGTGRGEGLLNRTVRRAADGRPYIPASAVKGALRQAAERLVGRLNQEVVGLPPENRLGQRRRAGRVLDVPCLAPRPEDMCQGASACLLCRIFGNVFVGTRLVVDHAYAVARTDLAMSLSRLVPLGVLAAGSEQHAARDVLTRVRINRRRRGAEAEALFSSEYIRQHDFVFHGGLDGIVGWTLVDGQRAAGPDNPPVELVLLAAALRFVDQVGAEASTGHGACRFEVPGNVLRAGGAAYGIDQLLDSFGDLVYVNL